MGIIEFFKIKLTTGKRCLDSLTSVNERLEHAKAELIKKKKLLEKQAVAVHHHAKDIEDRVTTATDNANQALEHAKAFLADGDEVNAKIQYKQYEIATKAKELYEKALEKARENEKKVDESVTNYDIMVGEVMGEIYRLKTMDDVNKISDFTVNEVGIPADISEFLTKLEADIKDETFEKESKAEVAALSKVSVVKSSGFSSAASDANFEAFKASLRG